jgi:mannose/cellobiose epimerase-like protein (N-acyl-D-glucosamine 2-epimerase family)
MGSSYFNAKLKGEMNMNQLNGLTVQLPIIGQVTGKDENARTITVATRGGAVFEVRIKPTTWFDTVTNLDRLNRQRLPLDYHPPAIAGPTPGPLETNIAVGDLIAMEGMQYVYADNLRYEAMTIHLLKSHKGYYLFEHTFWWKEQIEAMANKWLDVLFGDKRTYALDDFSAMYRTSLSIEGQPTDDATQEMATLSRLIYGLSSAYLVGGDERYFLAAKAGVDYQRETFRSYSADGRFCLWLHARKRDRHGTFDVLQCLFDDDLNTIPLYEQIYALAGLAQYYRITNDRETLEDISHTLCTFEAMYADRREGRCSAKHDGFFSHIDAVTFRWDSPELDARGNRSRKNWNSTGDHLPAYLINLILSLDPLPQVADDPGGEHRHFLSKLLKDCTEILDVTSCLIAKWFPEEGCDYVNERFDRDWNRIQNWRWQQNRGVVGHNLKIAWNLTRVANYYRAKGDTGRADDLFAVARNIGEKMARLGIDQVRSGVYDAMERRPAGAPEIPIQFAWLNTKDFWQQEQGILAYLIMFGHFENPVEEEADRFLKLARELSTFWNLYFLDRERNGIFFRVGDNGIPVLSSTYGDKGGHSISGYHAFELDYLAHIYQLAYLPREQQQHTTFCLHFRPSGKSGLSSINVLPDFLGPDVVKIAKVEIDGIPREFDPIPSDFQIPLRPDDLDRHVKVFLCQSDEAHKRLAPRAIPDENLP